MPATYYFVGYPFQSGILLLFTLFFKMFGDAAPLAIQITNVVANSTAVVMLTLIVFALVKNVRIRAMTPIFLGFCIPHLLYASFMYGNQIGFCLITVFLAFNVYALKSSNFKQQIILLLCSLVPLCFMMWIKSTFIVVALACGLIWVLKLLSNPTLKSGTLCILFAGILAANSFAAAVPQHVLESKLGYSLGKGMPKTAWIAIGLSEESLFGKSMPGWWSPSALESLNATQNNYEQQEQIAKQKIMQSLGTYVTQPLRGSKFFLHKLATEWLNPDFQARFFASINYEVQGNLSDTSNFRQFNVYARDPAIADKRAVEIENALSQTQALMPFMEAYQSFIYIFAALGSYALLGLLKDAQGRPNGLVHLPELCLLPCVSCFGFAVYLLWEAKSQYVMPYFIMLIPLAAMGFDWLVFHKLPNRKSQDTNASTQDN